MTQGKVVILYLRFGTIYRSHLQGTRSPITSWPLKMGPIRCPETSVKDYHSTLRNTPEEHRSLQHRGRSLKSRKCNSCYQILLGGIGEACVEHGGQKCIQTFDGESWKKNITLKIQVSVGGSYYNWEKYRNMEYIWVIWLSIWTIGGLLWSRYWIFEFHGTLGISWLVHKLLASEGLCSMELSRGRRRHAICRVCR
jgi:hypothetical protein